MLRPTGSGSPSRFLSSCNRRARLARSSAQRRLASDRFLALSAFCRCSVSERGESRGAPSGPRGVVPPLSAATPTGDPAAADPAAAAAADGARDGAAAGCRSTGVSRLRAVERTGGAILMGGAFAIAKGTTPPLPFGEKALYPANAIPSEAEPILPVPSPPPHPPMPSSSSSAPAPVTSSR